MSNDAKTDKHDVPDPVENSTDEPVRRGGSRPGPILTSTDSIEIRRVSDGKKL